MNSNDTLTGTDQRTEKSLRSFPDIQILVIRFSSFGDIVQAGSVPAAILSTFPGARVDWLVRADFASLLTEHPSIRNVEIFARKQGLFGLIQLAWKIGLRDYDHVYDAHSNVRSRIVTAVLGFQGLVRRLRGQRGIGPKFTVRSKQRLRRWLFFRFRLPTLPRPYRGALSFLWPLQSWGIAAEMPPGPQFFPSKEVPASLMEHLRPYPRPWIALAPSAAWPTKRWPVTHWERLILAMPEATFILLGGPEDQFLKELKRAAPTRVVNVAGRLTLSESTAFVNICDLVIANDTGLLHVADQLERPTIALIGPTAFGYPSHKTSVTLEIDLPCKPCSKDGSDPCRNSVYQRCLVELAPERVIETAREMLKGQRGNLV